jgi:acyl-CoA hydrolase
MNRDLTTGVLADRVQDSVTRTARQVLPGITNNYNTLYGGTLLGWMDEIAAITAGRFGRCLFVTASLDRTDFHHPIPAGSIVEMVARVTGLGRTSLQVRVEVFVEGLFAPDRLHAVTGLFTMVAIGENRRPIPIDV